MTYSLRITAYTARISRRQIANAQTLRVAFTRHTHGAPQPTESAIAIAAGPGPDVRVAILVDRARTRADRRIVGPAADIWLHDFATEICDALRGIPAR